MSDDKFIEKTLSSKTVYHGRIFDIISDDIELSDGTKKHREVIIHPGGVVIAAIKDEKIILVRQFRYPTHSVQIELPAGRLEKGEDPLLAAKRELREETGYEAKNWASLGYIFTTFGICNEKLYLFKAEDLTFVKQQPDEGEIIEYFECELKEVYNMIKNGTINDAKTICALLRMKL